MHRRLWFLLFVTTAIALFGAAPMPQVAQDPAALKQQITERIEAEIAEKNIVGLSVGFYLRGKGAETMHFGWQDRENRIAASDDTMYRWASISKPLTAVVTMQLAREGKLDLDRDIRVYVPEFPQKPWTITARHLLCHQGGIVHYSNGEVIVTKRGYNISHPFQNVVLALDKFKESPLVAEPGTEYAYSTHGYILLSAVAQRAGDENFADQVRRRIARPLKMQTLRPDYQWENISNRTIGYRPGSGGGAMNRSGDTDVSWKLGGGGFISNIADLTRFGAGIVDLQIVDQSTRDLMWAHQRTADNGATSYGLGFGLRVIDDQLVANHSGSQQKAATYLLMDAESGIVVALMSNTEGTRLHMLAADLLPLLKPIVQP